MSREQLAEIVAQIQSAPRQPFSIAGVRRDWYVESDDIPSGVERRMIGIGPHLRAESLSGPDCRKDRVILYLHGGGYVCGSCATHRPLTNHLALNFKGSIVSVDYRRAPEHPFPAAVEDAVAAYRHILEQGCAPRGVVIAGDSAGGGLAIATALKCRAEKLPQPGALWAISPWADLTNTTAALDRLEIGDPIVFKESLVGCAAAYLAGHTPRDPLASPVLADLSGLPPILIQIGGREILIDDAYALARAATAANVGVTLEVWPDMVHVWHLLAPLLDEGRTAIASALHWIETIAPVQMQSEQ